MAVKTFDIYLAGKVIDRVYRENYTTDDVRLDYINRHGLPMSVQAKRVSEKNVKSKKVPA